uniref:Uncharacterized protein n=1 Tax=Aegilops tauschii subsp. strangulata TaxID=200361 RepID=A0A453D700_AEGTS
RPRARRGVRGHGGRPPPRRRPQLEVSNLTLNHVPVSLVTLISLPNSRVVGFCPLLPGTSAVW